MSNEIIAVSASNFKQYGCVHCGCEYCYGTVISGGGSHPVKCGECDGFFVVLSDGVKESCIGFGSPPIYPNLQEHPRKGIPSHPYVRPDNPPENGGEWFSSRGVGYDLAGFVKCKAAGERVVEMFKKVLGKEPKTFLDYRKHEPNWIQVKVQKEDVDLDKLHNLLEDGIITEEKIKISVIRRDVKMYPEELNILASSIDDLTLNENPFESLERTISFSSKDFSECKEDAWIYGIICGWDCKDTDDECSELEFFKEFNKKFGWNEDKWKRLQLLRENYLKAKENFRQLISLTKNNAKYLHEYNKNKGGNCNDKNC